MKALVCGEGLIDLVKQPDGSWIAHNGGGALNTAKALAKLGKDVEFLGRIATDPFGEQLRSDISSSSVATSLAVTAAEPTSLAVVELADDGSAKYSFYLENTSNFCWRDSELPSDISDFDLVHIGTLSLVIEPGREVLFDWLARNHHSAVVVLDLNVRPTVISNPENYRKLVEPWLEFGDILKVSDEDLNFLYPEKTWSEVIDTYFAQTDLSFIAVTLGSEGAAIVTRNATVQLPAPKVTVVDTVGAGDTFSAGLIATLDSLGRLSKSDLSQLDESTLIAILKFAIAAAALNCTKAGAAAPTEAEVLEALDGN
jgi:fructokinase